MRGFLRTERLELTISPNSLLNGREAAAYFPLPVRHREAQALPRRSRRRRVQVLAPDQRVQVLVREAAAEDGRGIDSIIGVDVFDD